VNFNAVGMVMFLGAFGAGYGLARALGSQSEGLMMLLAGPALALFDLALRRVKKLRLLDRRAGGIALFVPIWLWGVFWTGLGAVYYWQGN
jgi:hypothetical protein